ncbi:SDR family NAD(P)-dependent oxidoreductase [Nannocystis sp.]|uniref:SDR family NAD(P)-dependent oxidoreductase n=1 Tax=Nannocystis sp. TaxID=1962667 RepID=UPI002600D073|nr:SDR family NAD(P)-dependent oxidoreductase [Nannocystis sp.]MBK7826877.1 SDR family NAD(P)-dependent oxidoreductase [Nannocystis sp.]
MTAPLAAAEPNRLALVTGACSGIGRALAEGLAARGHPLVLVSERPAALAEAAAAIREAHGVPVQIVALDLARPEAAAELHAAVRELGLEVDILVNNAGFFFFGETVDADPARASAMLQLHVVTPSLLCTHFGRDMRARGRGHILLVASISAWRDFPGINYYGSSKKYLRGFARALRCELGVHGVNVTCLAPGATATALYSGTSVPVERARRLGVMMDAEVVAEAGLTAMFARRAEHIPGRLTRAMTLAAVLTPQWVIDLLRRHGPWLRRRVDPPRS